MIKYITSNIVRINEILFNVGSETLEALGIDLVNNKDRCVIEKSMNYPMNGTVC